MLKAIAYTVAALLVLVALSFGIVTAAKSISVGVSYSEQKDCNEGAKYEHVAKPDCPKNETLWARGLREPVAFYTLLLTLFTLTLAVGAATQSILIGRQIILLRDEFNATHRPKIILRDVAFITEGGEDRILFMLLNIGTSKAIVIESWILTEIVANGDYSRNLRSAGHNDLGNLELVAGESRDLTIRAFDQPNVLIRRNPMGSQALNFAGSILYADSAGHRRRSVFRRIYDAHRDRFIRTDDPDQEYAD